MAVTLDLTVDQGADYSTVILLQDSEENPRDLSNYTARMQIREYVFSDEYILELTTENSKIVIDGPNGSIQILMDADDTNLLTTKYAVYDFELIGQDNSIERLLEGKITISPNVTR